jgi:hypothetical protein
VAIIRVNHTANFTVISNDLINDSRLDYRDVGLLVYLLSKPDSWEVSVAHLQKIKKSSRDAVYASLKSIIAAGYATKKPNPHGGYDYQVFECPLTDIPLTDIPLTDIPLTDIPLTDIPLTDIPLTDIPPQVNTEYTTKPDVKKILKQKANTDTHTKQPEPKKPASPAKKPRACSVKNSPLILNEEQKQCREWALTIPFWQAQVSTEERFSQLYAMATPRGLKAQYEEFQAIKSLGSASNTSQGLNITQLNGGNYGTKPTRQPASTQHFSDPSYYSTGSTDF